jgi:hypothetical protein
MRPTHLTARAGLLKSHAATPAVESPAVNGMMVGAAWYQIFTEICAPVTTTSPW